MVQKPPTQITVMGRQIVCSDCHEIYYSVGGHTCPGSDTDRINSLEEEVENLKEQIAIIKKAIGYTDER